MSAVWADRDAPGAVEHTPTRIRPYATLSPAGVLRARAVIDGRFGRADDEPTTLDTPDAP